MDWWRKNLDYCTHPHCLPNACFSSAHLSLCISTKNKTKQCCNCFFFFFFLHIFETGTVTIWFHPFPLQLIKARPRAGVKRAKSSWLILTWEDKAAVPKRGSCCWRQAVAHHEISPCHPLLVTMAPFPPATWYSFDSWSLSLSQFSKQVAVCSSQPEWNN